MNISKNMIKALMGLVAAALIALGVFHTDLASGCGGGITDPDAGVTGGVVDGGFTGGTDEDGGVDPSTGGVDAGPTGGTVATGGVVATGGDPGTGGTTSTGGSATTGGSTGGSGGGMASMYPPVDMTTVPTDGYPGKPYMVPTTSEFGQPFPAAPIYEQYTPYDKFCPPSTTDGAVRMECKWSHMLADDPIVFPGEPGRAHMHAFWGNTAANAFSTASDILNSGNSTCIGGTRNRSAYWQPAFVNLNTGALIRPGDMIVYYKSTPFQGNTPQSVTDLPNGLKMIAGGYKDGSAPPPASNPRYDCKVKQANGTVGNSILPGGAQYTIPACPAGYYLHSQVDFPQCWDGVNLDSPDHRSHVVYGTGVGCPSTHPVVLPIITINVNTEVPAGDDASNWALTSDKYLETDPTQPRGKSLHADWVMGWDEANKAVMLNSLQTMENCSNVLGDYWGLAW